MKLHDAESKLRSQQASGSSSGSERSTTSPRQSPTKDDFMSRLQRPDDDVKMIVSRLLKEEDILRHGQVEMTGNSVNDKEMMILLQQRKIAALDEANNRLINELSKLGEKVGYRNNNFSKKVVQETPKTVDELLDSFSDTRV